MEVRLKILIRKKSSNYLQATDCLILYIEFTGGDIIIKHYLIYYLNMIFLYQHHLSDAGLASSIAYF